MVGTTKNPCCLCHKNVIKKGIYCNQCNLWNHLKCNNITVVGYETFPNEPDDFPLFCISCTIAYH